MYSCALLRLLPVHIVIAIVFDIMCPNETEQESIFRRGELSLMDPIRAINFSIVLATFRWLAELGG